MAQDSKPTRRRGNSNAAKQKTAPQTPLIEAKSAHTADPALQPFLASTFDPANFLNSTLPPLRATTTSFKDAIPLGDLSTQTQTLLSQLNAQTTRLTSTLTQLTDEILRSGSRLAYEVEVLRGETLGLSEALTEGLQEDISRFVPGGLEQELAKRPGERRRSSVAVPKIPIAGDSTINGVADPPYITQLRTLTLVKTRLDMVIKTFGDAMEWTFPPSEVSVSSSFLSVSAPEPGTDQATTEEKGQRVSKKLREEIAELLIGDDPVDAIEAAAKRVEELKELAGVWKGTAEEKSRTKFVESLAKMVEDRHRELLRDAEKDTGLRQRVETLQEENEPLAEEGRFSGGYGFMSRLQKLRGAT